MRISKLPLMRLLALTLVPLLGGCLEFETQTIDFSYDAAADRATLNLVYHGLHWGKKDQGKGTKVLKEAVDSGEFCLIDWPFHFNPEELRKQEHPGVQSLGANLRSHVVGFFKDADGQLACGQIVTIDNVSELLKLANAELDKSLIESQGQPKKTKWDRHTRAMLLAAAKNGHAWFRVRGNAIELHAFCSEHDYILFKRESLGSLLQMKAEDQGGAIAWLSRLPISWQRSGKTIVLAYGNPKGRTRFVVPREGRKPYKPNLAEFAQKTWGYKLDGVVAQKLMKPDDSNVGRFARALGLRERVRILLTQEGDTASARLKETLDELPKEPTLDDEGGVRGFWQEWLKSQRRPPLKAADPDAPEPPTVDGKEYK